MKSYNELMNQTSLIKKLEEQEATIVSLEHALQVCKKEHADNVASHKLIQSQLREANQNLVIASIQAQTMVEVAEQAKSQMSHMAKHDTLTNLPNRLLLNDRLMQSMSFAKRYGHQVALIFLDLDHFKNINDSLGHAIGDLLLQSVAKRLQSCVRLSDTVSRYGGDEFVVLLSEVADGQDAITIAEKLKVAMIPPHHINGHMLHVTMSIGISLYPESSKSFETLVRDADTAMYQAKKRGRNRYLLFTSDMNLRAVARQSIEQALHQAVQHKEFLLHYQPKVNLETGHITGAEALLRWQRFENRLIYPVEFVNVAEDCGIILPIGNWVLHEACRQTQAWVKAGVELKQIAVNVSATEFHNKDFISGIQDVLHDTKLDPRYLQLELTESGLMQDIETTEILHTLKDMGVQIAVDDFGTGYSSLSYLRNFPIDTLKIDQSFVRDIVDGTGETIVSAIIAMGVSLKHCVVAEGIETQQQLDFLKTSKCMEGQGYYFSKALPSDEFATLLH
jgi:diguanylate cyclase (GGDEF)-like protein